MYTGTADLARQAVAASGYSLEDLEALDVEPGLGNGGLGRLAACLLDSLATLDVPAVGYGIRYEFGIFKQAFEDGQQIELPDDWTFYGNPWEFPAPDDLQVVGFYGHTEPVDDDQGGLRARWVPGEMVRGEPSHMLVPGYGTETVNILRLWRARAGRESFDLGLFNAGRYAEAVEAQMRSENLTKVLYPSDSTEAGRELRLKQQYFLVSCSLRDIIRRFRFRNSDWEAFPDKVVIQLNDTHPVLAIPELMRLLVDENGIGWEQAWSITRRTFAYTCHTLLPEALETWPVPMFGRLLPRHLEIIYALNRSFLEDVRARYPGDDERIARMSLIQEGPEHRVRMANLAVVGSFAVNGVAELQSRLLAQTTLRDFADLWPEKFLNVTNGVSPRRFLRLANPRLSGLITARLGDQRWLTDLDRLAELEAFADDAEFRAQWREAKRLNKLDLAAHVLAATGVTIDPGSLFDVMVKRLHEYKRQFLKLLHVVTLYNRIKADPAAAVTPCTVIFGAKAAPGYQQAKRIIKLINSVAAVVNADPDVGRPDQGRVHSRLQRLGRRGRGGRRQPLRADLAGRQGGLGHRQHETGPQRRPHRRHARRRQHRDPRPGRAGNFFLFGVTADQAVAIRQGGYSPRAWYEGDAELKAAIDALASGAFSGGDRDAVRAGPLLDPRLGRVPGPGRLPVLHRLPRPGRRARLGRPRPVDPDVDPEHGALGFLLLRPHSPRLQPRHLARRARTRTPVPGGRPSTSQPEFLSDNDSALTRFEDIAQVFDNLTDASTTRLTAPARKANLDRHPRDRRESTQSTHDLPGPPLPSCRNSETARPRHRPWARTPRVCAILSAVTENYSPRHGGGGVQAGQT